VEECERPRSYAVQLENGNVVERNRKHLYKFKPKSKFEVQNMSSELTESEDKDKETNVTKNINAKEVLEKEGERVEERSKRQIKKPKYLENYVT